MHNTKGQGPYPLDNFPSIEDEKWSAIPTLPINIQVSTAGRIRDCITPTQAILADLLSTTDGYSFFKGNPVHRLVAETFIANPDNLRVVNHKNGDKKDNRVENLEWVSHIQNLLKSYSCGTNCRPKIYCQELRQAYGSLRTAAFLTRIPQDIISRSIKEGKKICGLTFHQVEREDISSYADSVSYIDFDAMFDIATQVNSADEMVEIAKKQIEQECPNG